MADVQVANRRLMIPSSRKGRGKARAPVAFPIDESLLATLRPAMEGRRPDEHLLTRWYQRLEPGFVWVRDRRGPWAASGLNRDWEEIIRIAQCPDADPYCFRHAAIVRALRKGTPVRVVAALFDTSIAMIERHYSAHILDVMDDMVAHIALELPAGIGAMGGASRR